MLILSRRVDEIIDIRLPLMIDGKRTIEVLVKSVNRKTGVAEIGIRATDSIDIVRREISGQYKYKEAVNNGNY